MIAGVGFSFFFFHSFKNEVNSGFGYSGEVDFCANAEFCCRGFTFFFLRLRQRFNYSKCVCFPIANRGIIFKNVQRIFAKVHYSGIADFSACFLKDGIFCILLALAFHFRVKAFESDRIDFFFAVNSLLIFHFFLLPYQVFAVPSGFCGARRSQFVGAAVGSAPLLYPGAQSAALVLCCAAARTRDAADGTSDHCRIGRKVVAFDVSAVDDADISDMFAEIAPAALCCGSIGGTSLAVCPAELLENRRWIVSVALFAGDVLFADLSDGGTQNIVTACTLDKIFPEWCGGFRDYGSHLCRPERVKLFPLHNFSCFYAWLHVLGSAGLYFGFLLPAAGGAGGRCQTDGS